MKVALIDDEADARHALRTYLEQWLPDMAVQEADGVASGLKLIDTQRPELVFLDVKMKDGTGFDLLRQLPAIDFKLVIVSGHNEYALQAFRFSAIDYLVKPVDADELKATVTRIRKMEQPPWQQVMDVLRQNVHPAQEPDRKIVLKDAQAVYVVSVNTIVRCEASDNYTTFFLTDQAPIIVSRPLKEYDELLTPLKFVRVHQSHLINLYHLQRFNKREGGSIKMKDGSEVPVSSRKREALLAELAKL
jgi:two-component system LytT family response regulator